MKREDGGKEFVALVTALSKFAQKTVLKINWSVKTLRVMGSWVVLTLHYNGIADKRPVCHLLLIILKSKFESKLK